MGRRSYAAAGVVMSRTVTVEVDIEDVVDAMSDAEVLREYTRRGLNKKDEPGARETVMRAINMINIGRVADGVTLLEREFLPRWKDKADCEAAYRVAIGLGSQ